jgi:hypothetical protein
MNVRRLFATGTVLALVLTGCGKNSAPEPATTESASRTSESSTMDPQDVEEILAVFDGYRTALRTANESGTDSPTEELRKYLADPLLTEAVAQLHRNRLRGVYYAGASVASDSKVTDLQADGQPPTATILTCVDNSSYRLVYRSNGSPVPVPSGNRRSRASYTATYIGGQGWRISDSTSLDQPC